MVKKIFLALFFVLLLFCVFNLVSDIYYHDKANQFYNDIQLQVEEVKQRTNDSSLSDLFNDISDFRGYIEIDDTDIAYPIVQSTNNSYYLNHLVDGQENEMGSIFLDYRNNSFNDFHSVIYGHNIDQGGMFKDLEKFKSKAFFDAHPTMTIETNDDILNYSLYAVYLADATREEIPVYFDDLSSRQAYLDSISSRALYKTDVLVTVNDKLVSLCTCVYDFNEARIVVLYVLND